VKRSPVLIVCKEETTVLAVVPRFGEGGAEALEQGRIFVGKRRATGSDPIRAGDEIWMYPARPPPRFPPRILFTRDGMVAAFKPPDMATVADHRGAAGSLEAEVARMVGRSTPLVATSRLDVGVSGVVLFAADDEARQRLARAREEGRYLRHYVAICQSAPAPEHGHWKGAIGRARDPRLRRIDGKSAVRAETAYRVVATAAKGTLLGVEPRTGRTHQIRVHAAHAGCPLWGDAAYGGPTRLVSAAGVVTQVERIALHAAWVEVPLRDGGVVRAEAEVPEDIQAIWAMCGGDSSVFAGALRAIYPPET
jgi:23S rRNA pseudouridine1911/1915/1917 synthase